MSENTITADKIVEMIEDEEKSIFVTGKAGTGKSTLLNEVANLTSLSYAILAPTGLAAINIGGQTIHSFFRTKPNLTPEKAGEIAMNNEKLMAVLWNVELLIIDEISMVRADLMDTMDEILKRCTGNPKPFGGKKLLMFGDLFQLSPVAPNKDPNKRRDRDREDTFWEQGYKSEFFFDAKIIEAFEYDTIELTKIWRQDNADFVGILNRMREGSITTEDINKLNKQVDRNVMNGNIEKGTVILATTNDIVSEQNTKALGAIPSPNFISDAIVTGKFPRSMYPTDDQLIIKEGAQVMFTRNDSDGAYVNGTIGKIESIEEARIIEENGLAGPLTTVVMVRVENDELEEPHYIKVYPHTWENYTSEVRNGRLEKQVLGTFKQYPIKLAYAMTMHKSQGQTFDKMILDFGRGAFAGGQTYVAFSRCRTLQGIKLKRPLFGKDIKVNQRVIEYMKERREQK